MMTTLMQASQQWFKRPADERFTSLYDMQRVMHDKRNISRQDVQTTRKLLVRPVNNDPRSRELAIDIEEGRMQGQHLSPTHMAFGQLCSLAATPSPASYFRESRLPASYISDCLNYNLRSRDIEDIGLLGLLGDDPELRAATGPNYGRVWDADVVDALVMDFGDGVSGDWRVPGEFGKRVEVSKANTTLFASDRDMFVFLADEERRIETAGRNLARGFFVWNSEVGDKTLGLGFFLFDYVCCNRIVWGAHQYTEVRVRHTKGAPDRWLEEVVPVLTEYSRGSAQPVMQAIEQAREQKMGDDLDKLLANRFGKSLVEPIKAIHLAEEGRPIETAWDMTVAATAHARSIPNNDKRLEIEREAGALLKAA
jgi:hypothetical protein